MYFKGGGPRDGETIKFPNIGKTIVFPDAGLTKIDFGPLWETGRELMGYHVYYVTLRSSRRAVAEYCGTT